MSVTVHIKYENIDETFTGDADDVWISVNRFFNQMIPLFDIARSVVLTVDLKAVLEASKDLVGVSEEGAIVLVSKQKLTDTESLLLKLLGAYIGRQLGLLDRSDLSIEELQRWLGKSGKITSTRLGELCREGLVKTSQKGSYRLSTLGIKQLVDEVLTRIKNKN